MESSSCACLCLLICFALTSADPDVVRVVVKEDDDAVLNCSFTSGSVKEKLFDWKKISDDGRLLEVYMYDNGITYATQDGQDPQFKGRVSHFKDRLEAGDASIRIRKAEVRDTGNYTCEFPRDPPRLRSRISLVVGASPKPHIWTVEPTNNRQLWQCDVDGAFPKPVVEWKDSSGEVLPSVETNSTEIENHFFISLQVNVTKTDKYICVVTQEEIHHCTQAHTSVHIEQGISAGAIGVIAVLVTLLVVIVILVCLHRNGCITLKSKKGTEGVKEDQETQPIRQ